MFDQNKLNDMNKALQETIDLIQESKILNSKRRSAEESLSSLKYQLEGLKKQLMKEEKDVEKLQTLSFSNLLHSLINDKDEKLTAEQKEVLIVKAQIDNLEYEINTTEGLINELNKKLNNIGDIQSRYETLFEDKKAYIEAEMPDKWQEIDRHTKKKYQYMQMQKEVREALAAGKTVMNSVESIKDSLDSAAGWGVYDMIGGGMISTMIKRDHMDQAQSKINHLQYDLKNFNRELQDVKSSLNIDLQIGNFLGFADWFFDGFFVDMMVQSKINDALNQINSVKSKVQVIISNLQKEENTLIRNMNEEDELIKDIIKQI